MTSLASTPDPPLMRVIRLWSELTGFPINHAVMKRLSGLDERVALFEADDDTLVKTAHELLHVHGHLAFSDWVRVIENAQRTQHLQSGGSLADAPRLIGSCETNQRYLDCVTDFLCESVQASWVRGVDQGTLQEAVARIDDRAATGDYRLGSLVQRKPKWRQAPTRVVGRPPVIEVDAAEALIVHLLALTHPDAQFAATPMSSNRVFAGWKTSYHGDQNERLYVTGLSDVLDSVSNVVQSHRAGDGGRFYVRDGAVECPDCRSVIAWVGCAKDPRPAPPKHISGRQPKDTLQPISLDPRDGWLR
jgi:hypothetical protein